VTVSAQLSEFRSRRRRVLLQKWGPAYLLVLPATLLVLLVMLYPLIQTILFSLSTVQLPLLNTYFVGFQNFAQLFAPESDLGPLLLRTLAWVAGTVALRFVLGFLAALIFNARVRGTTWMRVLCVLPWTVPAVVTANLWRWILQTDNGVLNQSLRQLGLGGLANNWLADPHLAQVVVMVAYSWAGFPFIMLLLLAGLGGVPEEQYEAAKMDGANWWHLFRYITLPSLRGVILIAILLEVVSAINSFDMLWIMTAGGPGDASEILSIRIYKTAFTNYNLGGAAAYSVLLFVIGLVVFIAYGFSSGRSARRRGEIA
jgi:multiple sugar transport system permease protein